MSTNSIEGVILAAGRGTRMRHLGVESPKPLLPLCNRPTIVHQIEQMRHVGIEKVTIVIGHLGHLIVRHLTAHPVPGVEVEFVEQEQMLGIAHAVGCLESRISSPFLLFLGDIAFQAPNLGKMIEIQRTHGATVLGAMEDQDPASIRKNFSILHDKDGRVQRVVEKPRVIPNNLKGCGVYLFDPTVFDAIRKTPRTAARDEYEITDSIQILVDLGAPVHVTTVVEWDMNLTFPCDLLAANLHFKEAHGVRNMIGENCRLRSPDRINNSILADGVVVSSDVEIVDSLILPGSVIDREEPLRRTIVTPHQIIQCTQ